MKYDHENGELILGLLQIDVNIEERLFDLRSSEHAQTELVYFKVARCQTKQQNDGQKYEQIEFGELFEQPTLRGRCDDVAFEREGKHC